MTNEMIATIGIFFLLQFINVILNTGKTLIMSRTDNPHLSAIINAVTFGFYVAVVKQIAGLDLTITIIITIVTNVIGVYVTYAIVKKLKKDSLWKVEIFAEYDAYDYIKEGLELNDIPFSVITDKILVAYCYTQNQSETVNQFIIEGRHCNNLLNPVHYNITEITKKF